MGVKASPGHRANRRCHEQHKQRYPLRLHVPPEMFMISLSQRRTDHQGQTNAQECERSKERLGPKHVRHFMHSDCPVECIAQNALFPEDNDGDWQRPKETGAKHGSLKDRSAWSQSATCAIARKKQIDAEWDCRDCCRLFE